MRISRYPLAIAIAMAAASTAHAQVTAPDGQIHVTCTSVAGVQFPSVVDQIIVNPITKRAWIDHACGSPGVFPAAVDQGMIVFDVVCKLSSGSIRTESYAIDRYTGTFTIVSKGNPMDVHGQCVAGQKQLF